MNERQKVSALGIANGAWLILFGPEVEHHKPVGVEVVVAGDRRAGVFAGERLV